MKTVYVKTTWIDDKTPVNAFNLNKIENAIYNLYASALTPSELTNGKGIKVNTTKNNSVEISVDETVMMSNTSLGIEIIEDNDVIDYNNKIIYFVLDNETKKLKKIIINGISAYEVE